MNETLETPETAVTVAPSVYENFVTPSAFVRTSDEGYELDIALPGVPKSGVEITFDDGILTVTGRRSNVDHGEVVYRESAEASFRRAFRLDPVIDAGRIEANLNQGVLTLRLPKTESARPRQIALN